MSQGSLIKAALLGGVLAAIASSIPLLNLLCCVWGVGGGAFAAWVIVSDSGGRAGTARCGGAGFLAGLVGGALCPPLTGFLSQLIQDPEQLQEEAARFAAMMGSGADQLSPDMMEAMVRGTSFIELNAWSVFAIVVSAAMFSFFGLLGGLLGGALLARKQPGSVVAPPLPTALPPSVPPAGAPLQPLEPQDLGELEPDELPELPPAPPRDEDPQA